MKEIIAILLLFITALVALFFLYSLLESVSPKILDKIYESRQSYKELYREKEKYRIQSAILSCMLDCTRMPNWIATTDEVICQMNCTRNVFENELYSTTTDTN